jgi:acetyl esterase/lipase
VGDDFIPDEIKTFAEQASVAPIRIPGYWYHQQGKPLLGGAKAAPGEEVIFYLHGGGFIHQSAHPKDIVSTSPTDTLKALPRIRRLLSMEYRLSVGEPFAPAAHPFPAALLDALSGYSYLVNSLHFEPKNILLGGDSCGANLAVALMRCIRELNNPAFGMPKAAILYSPWVDLGDSHITENSAAVNFAHIDFVITYVRNMWAAEVYTAPFVKGFYSTNPYVSPASKGLPVHIQQGLFKGFPKMFITGGDHEQFIDSIRTLKSRAENDIGKDSVTYMENKESTHDIVVYRWFEPERSQMLRKVAEWYSTLD